MIKILQIGLGPLGIKINKYIDEKESMETVAAVDIDPKLFNSNLGHLCNSSNTNILIKNNLAEINNINDIDVVVLATSSSIKSIVPQILEILDYGLPIVSTCEELFFSWDTNFDLSTELDHKAKEKKVAVVATGVNPGFLMDTLPTLLTSVCRKVDHIQVNRIQDAIIRRIPFQQKIGAGLTLEQFEEKKLLGTLRHVGLTESIQFIANAIGWELDQIEDNISPIIATQDISTDALIISKGNAMGVRQIGIGSDQGIEKIKLNFEAAVGLGSSYDQVIISGDPNINSKIEGGINGDIATCSIVLNTIPNLLNASPGLKTMKDLGIISFTI